ncbi:MAG: single-stranded DNA-binding protein [Chloroflexaceae bacterium]|nr:single-stranded DNA-binding protein [Chloroflexaceae bacterium]NJO04973.1 single-stranded DNA-binding protein [Chloroflexaceae bacterium]NJO84069.1 single-stranded DNA-binding protein [Blastochloris sp.]
MAKDLNKVMLIGRLGTDPDMRYTSSGNPVTTFRVAVSRQWKDSSGELREETEWFSIVTWNKLAEICHQHLGKNSRVYLEGRLQTRSWEDQQTGQTRYKTEVVASDMILLDSRAARESATVPAAEMPLQPPVDTTPASGPSGQRFDMDDDYIPPLDIGDEDIPY